MCYTAGATRVAELELAYELLALARGTDKIRLALLEGHVEVLGQHLATLRSKAKGICDDPCSGCGVCRLEDILKLKSTGGSDV